jgi:DNA-binding NtrC family response regulator
MNSLQPNKILILEDDQIQAGSLQSAARETGHHVYVFDKESAFYNNFKQLNPDLVLFWSTSPERDSRILNTLLFFNYWHPVLIFSDNTGMDDLVAANQNLIVKVFPPPYKRSKLMAAIDDAIHDPRIIPSTGRHAPVIVGNTPEMIRIKKMISGLGHNNDAVFIQGEAGTGRELLAENIHFTSNHDADSFIVVNVERQVIESGRNGQKESPLDQNYIVTDKERMILEGGGTIYFKAIDMLPLSLQGTFLQFFHDERLRKTRIITSSDLKIDPLVRKGLFRKDLYYRLNVIKIDMPSLRHRKADIPLLADFFITRHCLESNVRHFSLSDKVKKAFLAYGWPENVAEFEAFLAREALTNREDQIIAELDEMTWREKKKSDNGIKLKIITQHVIGKVEMEMIKRVLKKTNWNRRRAAENLTISYKSLLNKIKAYNLN